MLESSRPPLAPAHFLSIASLAREGYTHPYIGTSFLRVVYSGVLITRILISLCNHPYHCIPWSNIPG